MKLVAENRKIYALTTAGEIVLVIAWWEYEDAVLLPVNVNNFHDVCGYLYEGNLLNRGLEISDTFTVLHTLKDNYKERNSESIPKEEAGRITYSWLDRAKSMREGEVLTTNALWDYHEDIVD